MFAILEKVRGIVNVKKGNETMGRDRRKCKQAESRLKDAGIKYEGLGIQGPRIRCGGARGYQRAK